MERHIRGPFFVPAERIENSGRLYGVRSDHKLFSESTDFFKTSDIDDRQQLTDTRLVATLCGSILLQFSESSFPALESVVWRALVAMQGVRSTTLMFQACYGKNRMPSFVSTTLDSDWSNCHRSPVTWISGGLSIILIYTGELRSCFNPCSLLLVPSLWFCRNETTP